MPLLFNQNERRVTLPRHPIMFSLFKSKKNKTADATAKPTSLQEEAKALETGLAASRQQLSGGIKTLFQRHPNLDEDTLEALETHLLKADVGLDTTEALLEHLKHSLKSHHKSEALIPILHQALADILKPVSQPLTIDERHHPFVILVVGVNGAGKTTSIGKLAHLFTEQGTKVMLAAGDTFRAAAIEQLQIWGERTGVPVVAQSQGSDSASVIFDALESAKSKKMDVLIADTAGRLHSKSHLMEELKKVKRVIQKCDPTAPHEVLLVLDGSTGQNALIQAQAFHEAVGLTGIGITKLDGTAKGGMVFSLAHELKVPIRFIGVGEKIEDLHPLDPELFVKAIFE